MEFLEAQLFADIKELNQTLKAERNQKQQDYNNWIMNGHTFIVEMQILGKTGEEAYEEIELEGWENAIKIFECYRGYGHNMKLKYLKVSLDGKKIKRVNFTY